ncbi:MAG TPA: hypothetical protein VMT46_14805 [Anaerolineaceae bacterium]|nr:hypothetical protein [Anaerolineaceae bacterium]
MKPNAFRMSILLRCLAALFLLIATLSGGGIQKALAAPPRVAYVYGSDPAHTANAFNTMLTGRGITVDLYSDQQAALAATDFTPDQAIIISDDPDNTGGFDSFNNIWNSGKPVVAIGNWGSQFLGMTTLPTFAGVPIVPTSSYQAHVADPTAPVWSTPSPVSQINQTLALYTLAVSVNAYSNPAPFQFSTRIARVPGDPNHYSLLTDSSSGRCYAYWGYRGLPAAMTPSGVNLFLNMLFGNPCAPGTYSVNAALATNPPVMDGVFNYGEWSLTPNRYEMDHGFFLVMNDNIRLYLLVDVLESVVNDIQNDFWVTFDVNGDGFTPGVDLNYGLEGGTRNMRFRHYLAPANWDSLSTTTKSSLGPGFDCYTPDNTKILNINTQMFDCAPHQLWEIAIDLKEINAAPGQTIHMGLRTNAPVPQASQFVDELPNSFDVDFSNLIAVHLASQAIPPHDPNADIAFGAPPLEITQVIQNANNTIPLVGDKDTAGRVAVITTGVSSPQPVLEYLYGQRGGNDLPGSPLVQLVNAPLAYNRGKLNNSANFLLPSSWITVGDVTFHAEASDFNGHNIASSPLPLTLGSRKVPVYWIIQENNAAPNANPDLPAQATIDTYESYVRATFPVPDVTFVQKPWTVLGALNGATLQNNVNAVSKYYNAIAAAYWNAILQNKQPPYALPELIFGAANVGGGLSDPTWFNNGGGHAAAGGNASSGEGVVAHEFNHDLDRSSSGTWGRHVNACGATGPDPNWPNNPQTDPAIKEYGFDTRLPWQDTSSNKTVVPSSTPDLMSYCGSGFLPTKWIHPYRYQAWLGSPLFPAALLAGPGNSIYITGRLNLDGTGSLDPALFGPGMPITPSATGGYSVRVTGGSTITHFFDVLFEDLEGGPLDAVSFNFTLPDPGGVSKIELLHGAQVLATLERATDAPSGSFTAPAAGLLVGTVTVNWSLTPGTVPLAGLVQQLQFSADNGSTWTPVAVGLPGTTSSYGLDSSLLPMTTQGKLRLLVSDGLNNVTIDSPNTFSVGNHPPIVDILAPLANGFFPGGSPVPLQGQASDVDESSIPGSHFLWTLDGSETLGVGSNLHAVLPNGKHTLTLTVLDSNGGVGSASVTIRVNLYEVMLPLVRK